MRVHVCDGTAQASEQAAREVVCEESLRRESDRERHKCSSERQKPVWAQHGAAQCPVRSRWFHSKGGSADHRCTPGT